MFSYLTSPFRGVFDPTRELPSFLARYGVSSIQPASPNVVRDVYAARPDLREVFPLGLTPQQWEGLAAWLMEHGRPDLGITSDEVAAWLTHSANDPSLGLRDTWLLSPKLQHAVPDALTASGWKKLQKHIGQRWAAHARYVKPPNGDAAWGVNVLAHFRYPSGLQEEALQYVAAIRAHGGAVSLRDAPLHFTRHSLAEDLLGPECHPITLAKLGALESFDDQYPRCGWHPRPGVHRIASISWELATLPRALAGACDLANELWTPSAFCASAVQNAFPEKIVTPMLPAVSLPQFTPLPRSHFGLPDDRFLVYFAFDIGSVMERKNPLGLITAFRTAFRSDDRAHLVIKVTRGESRPHDLAKLKAAASDGNATIIDSVLPRAELAALLNCCDVYASLHRAEGFGYTIAEAMLLGKPTLATNDSANTEFMTLRTAIGIESSRVPIGIGCEPYPPECEWAEPDIRHAAAMLRWVYEHRDEATAMGERAKAELPQLLSPHAAGVRMVARFREIG